VQKKKSNRDNVKEYFGALPTKRCVEETINRVQSYYDDMKRLGRFALLRNAYFKYLSAWASKGYVSQGGAEGELSFSTVNHYGNLITHILNIVCQQKLSYEPQTKTSDFEALKQIRRAKGILNDYTDDATLDLDGKLRQGTEFSAVLGEGAISVLWNKNKGEEVLADPTTGKTIKAGDNEIKTWTPFDIIQDSNLPSQQHRTWLVLRDWVNRFDLAAEYPEFADDILAIATAADNSETMLRQSHESDLIPTYHLFHDKTPACPDGRHIYYATDTVIMSDDELDGDEIPVYRVAARELWGSPYGYSRGFDLLQLQDVLDRLISAVVTNQLTFAIQNIMLPKGSNLSWDQLYGGLNVIEYEAKLGQQSKPEALQLTSTAPETYQFIDKIVQAMGTIAGINDVMRGNPDLAIKGQASGAALALMITNAIQFNSDFGKAYVRLAEQVGTAIIRNIARNSKTQRNGSMLTRTNKYISEPYTSNDLGGIIKISVKYGNPLTQTTAGRLQIADTLFDKQKLSAQEYMNVIETGNLESQLDAENAEIILIKGENERLSKGEQFPSLIYDNHVLHMPEHMSVLASEEARNNPQVIEAVKFHVEHHAQMLRQLQSDPILVGLLKQPVIPQPPAPAPGGPPQGAPGGMPTGAIPNLAGAPGAPAQVNLPKNMSVV
jgi:hypothetical protein